MRPTLLAFLTATCAAAQAADTKQIMFSRYMRAQFCVERVLGQGYAKKLGIEMVVNQYGAPEPRMRSLRKQPDAVRAADTKCRKVNELGDELRPE